MGFEIGDIVNVYQQDINHTYLGVGKITNITTQGNLTLYSVNSLISGTVNWRFDELSLEKLESCPEPITCPAPLPCPAPTPCPIPEPCPTCAVCLPGSTNPIIYIVVVILIFIVLIRS